MCSTVQEQITTCGQNAIVKIGERTNIRPQKPTRVPCPCIIVLSIVQDRERPCETVRDRTTVRDRVGLYGTVYTTAHEVHSTSEPNRVNIAYKSYGIELEQKSMGPYVNSVNVPLIE